MEDDSNAILRHLDELKKKDPGYKSAIEAFIAAEAGIPDPLEGEVIIEGNLEKPGPAP